MRQKFLLVVSVLAIAGMWTGCSNEEAVAPSSNPTTAKQPISFRTQGGMPESRATETTTANVDAFVVYGAETDGTTPAILFNAVTVARQAGLTTFDYNPKKYYGKDATSANFVAFSPASANISNIADDPGPADKLLANPEETDPAVVFEYEVAKNDLNNAGKTFQEDLLVAGTKMDNLTNGQVNFQFQHALSRIFVKATNLLSENVVITGLELQKVCSTGKLSGTCNPDWVWTWSGQDNKTDYPYILADAGVAVIPEVDPTNPEAPVLVTSMEQGMMVLPQIIENHSSTDAPDVTEGDFALKVTYSVANLTGVEAYVYLDNGYEFEMGKQYAITVTFEIDEDNPSLIEIGFTIDVTSFGTSIDDADLYEPEETTP